MIDKDIRKQFPQLDRELYGHRLVYFDNAATTQSPLSVTDEYLRMEYEERANVHRGVHTMSQMATASIERTREAVARFINAASTEEVIFTSGTTDSINLVASSLTETFENGDEIILTAAEHHSNIVPWQLAGRFRRLRLKVVPLLA
ncbi:MAG: aminotransferase class V-fold PLP-dependent enzyme, partial [Muribaculaceae bacterium]|nr:aminotransferase class V-fold PLP-dependent enzyme [Muribaculaceae bacterium]